MKDLAVDQRGWLVYSSQLIPAIFLGYDHYQSPDFPGDTRRRYFRSLEAVDLGWSEIGCGSVIDQASGDSFYGTHEEAQAALLEESMATVARFEENLKEAIVRRDSMEAAS